MAGAGESPVGGDFFHRIAGLDKLFRGGGDAISQAELGKGDAHYVLELPAKTLTERQNECGIPFWPHGFVTAHCDMDTLLEAWNNEYACLGYGGRLYEELIAFCEQTGIRVIAL